MHALYLQFSLKFFVVHHGKYTIAQVSASATAKKSTFVSFFRFRVECEKIRIATLFLSFSSLREILIAHFRNSFFIYTFINDIQVWQGQSI